MNESILNSIKKLLGLSPDYDAFDTDLYLHINSVFSILQQLGVGPKEGFRLVNDDQIWNDFITNDEKLKDVITYVYLKVKLVFDPPTNSSILKANEELIKELEWRLNVAADDGTND